MLEALPMVQRSTPMRDVPRGHHAGTKSLCAYKRAHSCVGCSAYSAFANRVAMLAARLFLYPHSQP